MKRSNTFDWSKHPGSFRVVDATDREPEEEVEFDRLTWLDAKEAAEYLRKSINALHIMVNRGFLRPRRLRRRLYFRKIELDRLLESSTF